MISPRPSPERKLPDNSIERFSVRLLTRSISSSRKPIGPYSITPSCHTNSPVKRGLDPVPANSRSAFILPPAASICGNISARTATSLISILTCPFNPLLATSVSSRTLKSASMPPTLGNGRVAVPDRRSPLVISNARFPTPVGRENLPRGLSETVPADSSNLPMPVAPASGLPLHSILPLTRWSKLSGASTTCSSKASGTSTSSACSA